MRCWNVFCILGILTLQSSVFANTLILKCDLSHPKYTGHVSVDAVGQSVLKFKPKKVSKKDKHQKMISCPLFIHNIRDVSRGVSPRISLVFLKDACQSTPKNFDSSIFTRRIGLDISLLNVEKPRGRLRWLRASHPENCLIKNIRLSDLKLNAGKFYRGLWPVSQPKKHSSPPTQ